MDMRKLVGRNFGRLRREKGFTQEQFAEQVRISVDFLSLIERGITAAPLRSIRNCKLQIADLLKTAE